MNQEMRFPLSVCRQCPSVSRVPVSHCPRGLQRGGSRLLTNLDQEAQKGGRKQTMISLDSLPSYLRNSIIMLFSTHQVAKKLGISVPSLYRYIEQKKIPAPKALRIGNRNVRSWTESEIEHVRQLLPKIANGRKTRYSKLREKQKAQPKKTVPRKPKKKK
jgi:excisionase family DNA binding protein